MCSLLNIADAAQHRELLWHLAKQKRFHSPRNLLSVHLEQRNKTYGLRDLSPHLLTAFVTPLTQSMPAIFI